MREIVLYAGALLGLVVPYCVPLPFRFYLGVAFVIALACCCIGKEAFHRLGLVVGRSDVKKALSLLMFIWLVAHFTIPVVCESLGYDYRHYQSIGARLNPIFQSLNDEMVFRALLLGFVARKIGDTRANILTAVILTLAHELYYERVYHTSLAWQALVSIFLMMWVCNFVYLRARHIAYSFAVHAGWNLTRFGGRIYLASSPIPEGMTFNLVEASPLVLVLAVSLAAAVYVLRDHIEGAGKPHSAN